MLSRSHGKNRFSRGRRALAVPKPCISAYLDDPFDQLGHLRNVVGGRGPGWCGMWQAGGARVSPAAVPRATAPQAGRPVPFARPSRHRRAAGASRAGGRFQERGAGGKKGRRPGATSGGGRRPGGEHLAGDISAVFPATKPRIRFYKWTEARGRRVPGGRAGPATWRGQSKLSENRGLAAQNGTYFPPTPDLRSGRAPYSTPLAAPLVPAPLVGRRRAAAAQEATMATPTSAWTAGYVHGRPRQ